MSDEPMTPCEKAYAIWWDEFTHSGRYIGFHDAHRAGWNARGEADAKEVRNYYHAETVVEANIEKLKEPSE